MSWEVVILVVSCLGIAQALLLCIYLLSLKKTANVFLALLILGLVLRIGKSIVLNYVPLDPWVRNLGISGILLTGPFLLFYGFSLFQKWKPGRKHFFHLLPFIGFASACLLIPNRGDFWSYLAYSLLLAHLGAYLGFCWYYLLRQEGEPSLRKWYRNILAGVSVIWILYVGIFIRLVPFYILGAVSFSFLIYIFSYLMLKRHIFRLERYASSRISAAAAQDLHNRLKHFFEHTEAYLDSEISLQSAAERLSASPREVSRVVNELEGKNFSEFVNQYRVKRAGRLLADPAYEGQKIETIAFDCGFRNLTSFNLAFKAAFRETPSAYRGRRAVG